MKNRGKYRQQMANIYRVYMHYQQKQTNKKPKTQMGIHPLRGKKGNKYLKILSLSLLASKLIEVIMKWHFTLILITHYNCYYYQLSGSHCILANQEQKQSKV